VAWPRLGTSILGGQVCPAKSPNSSKASNEWFFAGGARKLGETLFQYGDAKLIDGVMVNGTAKAIGFFSGIVRKIQSGMVFHYAFVMIFGVFGLLTYWLLTSYR
jgi:NADH:ubiquinone oxidoreductase subunit 5 (subunit L)/multisubunit Na+/H+ antiporter MnhA subunit